MISLDLFVTKDNGVRCTYLSRWGRMRSGGRRYVGPTTGVLLHALHHSCLHGAGGNVGDVTAFLGVDVLLTGRMRGAFIVPKDGVGDSHKDHTSKCQQ